MPIRRTIKKHDEMIRHAFNEFSYFSNAATACVSSTALSAPAMMDP